jgi:hypothetical protein
MRTPSRLAVTAAAGVAIPMLAVSSALGASPTSTGPNSSDSPYLIPVAPGVTNTALLSVGDAADNGYRMVGIPDGLGAFDNGDGTITVLMNHELGSDRFGNPLGVERAHGAKGAFVSKWIIEKKSLRVLEGSDLIQDLELVNGDNVLSRLCSADLPPISAFYNATSGKGYDGRILMNGEEDGSDAKGRGFAHVIDTGVSYDLPYLGRFAWENSLAHPNTGDATVVVGTDDSTPGQVYVYAGQKRTSGTPVEKAGLFGGTLYGIKVANGLDEINNADFPLRSTFSLVELADADKMSVAQLQAASEAAKVTEFWRPEDGHWDTTNPNVFWFVTTANFTGPTRLWKATFADASNPALGGTIEAILDGTEGLHMLDNMTVADKGGQLLLQEDPGNQEYLARVYSYNTRTDRVTPILEHDPARFTSGAAGFLTQDEESSGVIDVSSLLGQGRYLLTTQVHTANPDAELVEYGQLQLVRVPWKNNGAK